jgi:hypothetical protein
MNCHYWSTIIAGVRLVGFMTNRFVKEKATATSEAYLPPL